jgi:hypothetical protein
MTEPACWCLHTILRAVVLPWSDPVRFQLSCLLGAVAMRTRDISGCSWKKVDRLLRTPLRVGLLHGEGSNLKGEKMED